MWVPNVKISTAAPRVIASSEMIVCLAIAASSWYLPGLAADAARSNPIRISIEVAMNMAATPTFITWIRTAEYNDCSDDDVERTHEDRQLTGAEIHVLRRMTRRLRRSMRRRERRRTTTRWWTEICTYFFSIDQTKMKSSYRQFACRWVDWITQNTKRQQTTAPMFARVRVVARIGTSLRNWRTVEDMTRRESAYSKNKLHSQGEFAWLVMRCLERHIYTSYSGK